ncbi:O-antigen ligase family protein [Paenibacillus thailandensis]|uniref:O-antigen ligase family protein n=1 Tax=Paenibacillus thailandensis TaxID=393250 RepID=A0ABW5QSL4_9BACL
MSTYSSKGRKNAYGNIPLLQWIMTIGVGLFIFIFPYNQALFNGYAFNFESKIYPAVIFAYILLIVTAVYLFRQNWSLASHRGILSIGVMLFAVVYWISSFQAAAPYYAKFMTLIVFALAALFVTALFAAEKWQMRKIIEYSLMGTSYIIVLFGLLNLFGQVYYRDAMWLSSTGYRLTSFFQYSNTYAGFLLALFFATLYYTTNCKRWYMNLIHALMLAPIWISFMLTYSRGAFVVIPVILLALIPFLSFMRQLLYIVYMVISVVVSMAFLGVITKNSEKISAIVQPTAERGPDTISLFSSLPLQSWLMLLAASVIIAAVIMHIQVRWSAKLEAKVQKLADRRGSFLFVPALIVVLGAIAAALLLTNNPIRSLLPDPIEERLSTINFQQHSVLERWTFYEDGLRLSQDYPLFGAGGGAWQALFQQYQNNPYWSKQAHSYFIQTLVEVGWIGLLLQLALLAYCYILYIRFYAKHPERRGSHLVFFIFSLALLVHSAIDFDMSYVYLSAILFVCLGAMLAPYGSLMGLKKTAAAVETGGVPAKGGNTSAKSSNGETRSYGKTIYASAIVIASLVLLFGAIRETNANGSYSKAIGMASSGSADINDLLGPINKAIELSPNHTQFSLVKLDWLNQVYQNTSEERFLKEALSTVDAAKKNDPYNRDIVLSRLQWLGRAGDMEGMLTEIEDGLDKFRWDITFYEIAIVEYVSVGETDSSKKEQYWNRAAEIGEEVQRRIDKLKDLPPEQLQGRSFDYTDKMKEALAKIQ